MDLEDSRPTYLQIADQLRRAVADGAYKVGEKLPSVRALAEQFGVAGATAARAVDVLRQEGLVVSRPGLGTVVRNTSVAAAPSLQEQVDDLRRRVEALEADRDR